MGICSESVIYKACVVRNTEFTHRKWVFWRRA